MLAVFDQYFVQFFYKVGRGNTHNTAKSGGIHIFGDTAGRDHQVEGHIIVQHRFPVAIHNTATGRIDHLTENSLIIGQYLIFIVPHLQIEQAENQHHSHCGK
ncbi:hypothetical protein D9M68_819370 [compost metagenome]